MHRTLTSDSSLESLRKEPKRWMENPDAQPDSKRA